jgi:ketosteroid isomerase-like protein
LILKRAWPAPVGLLDHIRQQEEMRYGIDNEAAHTLARGRDTKPHRYLGSGNPRQGRQRDDGTSRRTCWRSICFPPLQYQGAGAIKKRVSEWFASFEGSIGFQMRNLAITAGDDVAFCHSLNGVSGTSKDGAKVDMWWRATNCFRNIDGQWLITHGHSSEPFDMRSGKALLDLKP